ncbi:MAG: hypothetical protein RI897_3953 [Verrucomicrobiota bacterium]
MGFVVVLDRDLVGADAEHLDAADFFALCGEAGGTGWGLEEGVLAGDTEEHDGLGLGEASEDLANLDYLDFVLDVGGDGVGGVIRGVIG